MYNIRGGHCACNHDSAEKLTLDSEFQPECLIFRKGQLSRVTIIIIFIFRFLSDTSVYRNVNFIVYLAFVVLLGNYMYPEAHNKNLSLSLPHFPTRKGRNGPRVFTHGEFIALRTH